MYHNYKDGFIEVISGCMFAGKTEELLRRVRVLSFGKQKIQLFKPAIDNRFLEDEIVSHVGTSMKSTLVSTSKEILDNLDQDTKIVAIDEVQFFDNDIIDVVDYMADNGIRVMVAGLNLDFRGEPFGVMPTLLTKAEFVSKLSAICHKCGGPATRSQRMIDGKPADYNDPIILIGAAESYEAACRHCHIVLNKPNGNKR